MGANPRACLRNLRGIPLSVLVAVTNLFDGLVLLDKELPGWIFRSKASLEAFFEILKIFQRKT